MIANAGESLPLISYLDWVGYVSTFIVIVQGIGLACLGGAGILRTLYRIGDGFASRKVAIFAKGDAAISLSSLILESRLVRRQNLRCVTSIADISNAENDAVFVLHWPDWKDDIDTILDERTRSRIFLIYAPSGTANIPTAVFKALNDTPNVFVSQFRGRLLSDLVTGMIIRPHE